MVPLFQGRIRRVWVASADGTMRAHRVRATSSRHFDRHQRQRTFPQACRLAPGGRATVPPDAWSNPASAQDYQGCRRHSATQMNPGRDRWGFGRHRCYRARPPTQRGDSPFGLAQLYQFAEKSELDQCDPPKSLHYSGELFQRRWTFTIWWCVGPQPTRHSTDRKHTWSTLQTICGLASLIGFTFLVAHTPKIGLMHCQLVQLG